MPVKRSRVGRSSSFGDAGFLSQVPPPEHRWDKRSATPSNSAKILKPSDVAGDQQARPTILTVASPEMDRGRVDVSSEKPIGAFLEKCYYCNSKIRENVEVFMYGFLWGHRSIGGKKNCYVCNGCFYQRCERFSLDFEMFKVDGGPPVLTKDLNGVIFGDGQGEA